MFPNVENIDRTLVNAWDDPKFVEAVEKTGRKKLIMAGVTTDVCLTFPAISATAAGYDVYGVIDASGTWDQTVELVASMRMAQAGVIPTNWIAVAAELMKDHAAKAGADIRKVFASHMELYVFLSAIAQAKGQG